MVAAFLRFLVAFVPLYGVMSTQHPNMLERLGFDVSNVHALVTSLVVALLTFTYKPIYLALVVVIGVAANSPNGLIWDIDHDFALAALIAGLISPYVMGQLD